MEPSYLDLKTSDVIECFRHSIIQGYATTGASATQISILDLALQQPDIYAFALCFKPD